MVIALAGVMGMSVLKAPSLAAMLVAFAMGVPLLVVITLVMTRDEDEETRVRLVRWTTLSLIVHVVLAVFLARGSGVFDPRNYDGGTYHSYATGILNHWNLGFPIPDITSGKEGFPYLLAGIYWLVGPHIEIGLIINAALAAAMVPVMHDTTRRLFGPAAARYIPALVTFVPGFLLWTSLLLREAGILFLVAVIANCATRLSGRLSPGPLLVLPVALGLLFSFRGNVALVMTMGVVLALVISRGQTIGGFALGAGTSTVIFVVIVVLGLGYSGYQFSSGADLEEVNVIRSELSRANSGFAEDADVSTTSNAIVYLPIGLPNLLLGPYPWMIKSTRQAFLLPDLLVWWWLLPATWRGLRAGIRTAGRRTAILLLPGGMIAVALALVIGNFGTTIRERPQVLLLLMPFVALGLAVRQHPQVQAAPSTSPSVGHASHPLAAT
jgi:hypothetical protein